MRELDESLTRACHALQNAMTPTQRWVDYVLPVGESDEWVTAFVGVALAEAGTALGERAFYRSAEVAFLALLNNRTRPVGFGYNASVDADADSTATVLLLASLLKQAAPVGDIKFLQNHQRDDGGYATFQATNGWGQSHACVTPVAALALLRFGVEGPLDRLSLYGNAMRNADGTWPAYWWPGVLYATAAWLRLIQEAPLVDIKNSKQIFSAKILTLMDLALAVEISFRLQFPNRGEFLGTLIEHQHSSGFWSASKCLRVTDKHCTDHDRVYGETYADHNCLMTTAMAVRAISYAIKNSDCGSPKNIASKTHTHRVMEPV